MPGKTISTNGTHLIYWKETSEEQKRVYDFYINRAGLDFLKSEKILLAIFPVQVEVLSSPSIKHNFCCYFITFHPAPFHPPNPFLWHLHSSTPFHYLTSCDYDLPDKGFSLFTHSKVHKRSPSFSCQPDWLIVLTPCWLPGYVSWWLKLLTLTDAYPLWMHH